jgi:hypothetical protein
MSELGNYQIEICPQPVPLSSGEQSGRRDVDCHGGVDRQLT